MRNQILIIVFLSAICMATSCQHGVLFENSCNEKVSVVIYSKKGKDMEVLGSDTIPALEHWGIAITRGSKKDYKELMNSIDSLVIITHDMRYISIPASDFNEGEYPLVEIDCKGFLIRKSS